MVLGRFWVLRDPGDQATTAVVQPEDNEKCMTVSPRLRGASVYKVFGLCKNLSHCEEMHAHAVICAGYVFML
jgi:hypothetical protein